ncbi:MAG TPA: phosphoglycerate dehydrogenase [Gammaproteobacteria bacterium]|nr:phosphoglycerate dehydrogenase [Gammaproteobacteria bacterium]
MNSQELVVVTSRSFSKHPILRRRLQEKFSQVRFNEKGIELTGKLLIDFLQGARRAIIGLEIINEEILSYLPNLKVICKMGTGIDKIDIQALQRRQIAFTHTPGINHRSVSELVLGMIFVLMRHLPQVNTSICQGKWLQPKGRLLSEKTVGIIGFGSVGRDLSKLLSIFNCKCLIYDVQQHHELMPHVLQVNLNTLLVESDIISIHIPLLPENFHFIGSNEFTKMKKGSIFINTARGGLVDEQSLYEALVSDHLSAAALDVFENEPIISKNLLSLENFFATSHIGGSTDEAIEAMGMMAINNLEKWKYRK